MHDLRGEKVLLAMSGGVDSSAAAALLLDAGADVVGVFMRLGSPGETLDRLEPDAGDACKPAKIGKQGCCSVGDAADARRVAGQLGIPFYAVNFKRDFGRIIEYFVEEYARGRTPNPCVRCNDWLKFGRLHDYASQIGARFVASGHYARIGEQEGSPALLRGEDKDKDQSYVLFGAPRERLPSMLLPVGGMRKQDIREVARSRGLVTSDKPESQEICFVPDNDYARLVGERRPELESRGEIVDRDGRVVGEHGGQHRFTIGQRRGIGVAVGLPVYVVDKDPLTNRVMIGSKEDLLCVSCVAAEANWLVAPPARGDETRCLARYRSNGALFPATVRIVDDLEGPTPSGRSAAFEVMFDDPAEAVAPGQAIVLYAVDRPELVLGGGWIVGVDGPRG